MDKIVIRQFLPTEVAAYRYIRARALAENPEAFATSAEEFAKRPDSSVRARLEENFSADDRYMLGAFIDDKPVGMMGVIRWKHLKRQHIADIIAVFVVPEQRGNQLGGRLLDRAIELAHTMDGVEQLILGVVTTNKTAIGLYQSRGFEAYGTEPNALQSQGQYWDELLMVLRL